MGRHLIVWILSVILVGCYTKTEAPTGHFDFRKTSWGMSREEVILAEKEEAVYKSLTRVLFATSVIEKSVMLEYHLGDDQLYRARYMLADQHVIDDKYVADYQAFQGVLTAKYGRPKKNEKIWKEGVGRREDMHPGTLVSIGHLTLVSVWETADTEIVATLIGKNFKVQCDVTYTSKALRRLVEKYDTTDPELGGKGGELGSGFENEELRNATRDF